MWTILMDYTEQGGICPQSNQKRPVEGKKDRGVVRGLPGTSEGWV